MRRWDKGFTSIGVLILAAVSGCWCLEITRLSIPSFVLNGSEDSVLLDCEYDYDPVKDKKLVVKWFHEDHPEPVYQWIPELDMVLHSEKYRVNPDYQIPSGNSYTRSRALNIIRPTTEMSGRYSCQVASLDDGDLKEDCMVVYALPTQVTLNYTSIGDDTVLVYCEIEGVFPLPEVAMFQIGPGEVDPTPVEEVLMEYELENGIAYDVRVSTNISESELSLEGLSTFGCSVSLTGTDYQKVVRSPYFPSVVAARQKEDGTNEHDDDDDDDDDFKNKADWSHLESNLLLMTFFMSLTLLLT